MVRVQVNGKRRKRRKRRRKRKRRKKRKRKRRNRVTIEGGLFPFVDGSFLDMAAGMVYNFVHFYLLLNFYFCFRNNFREKRYFLSSKKLKLENWKLLTFLNDVNDVAMSADRGGGKGQSV